MASIIATFGVTGTQAGWIGTITNFGMLFGGIIFGMLADKAMQDPCKPGNPREVSREDFIELFRRAF